jgi:hypothetical protein
MCHATIELGSWTATLYLDMEAGITVEVLKKFYDSALELKFRAGSVGVVPLPNGSVSETTPYVTVLHCEREDAEAILKHMGLGSFFFIEAPEGEVTGEKAVKPKKVKRMAACC